MEHVHYGRHQIKTSRTVPGHPKYQESYRSEIPEILYVVLISENLCKKYKITEGAITAACADLESIKRPCIETLISHANKNTLSLYTPPTQN